MMYLQQTFFLNLDLHVTNVLESTSAGIHDHANHPALFLARTNNVWVQATSIQQATIFDNNAAFKKFS